MEAELALRAVAVGVEMGGIVRESFSRNPVEVLAEEFLARYRRGEQPRISEYQLHFPELADQIANAFPALAWLEQAASAGTGPGVVSPDRNPPDVLGDFRIVREVGRGGMGVVYEAEQISLTRRVALKVLPLAGVFDGRQLQRFRQEALAAATLNHGNIVPVYAVGCEQGVHYYAMQFIDGWPLSGLLDHLRASHPHSLRPTDGSATATVPDVIPSRESAVDGEPPSLPHRNTADLPSGDGVPNALESDWSRGAPAYCRTVVQRVIQVADALNHAHQHGVVHRDIKPGNLLLDRCGKIWITDFGLALLEAEPGLTMTGDLVGTLRYMSPEQALGRREEVGHRSDVYSLGVTLYELLTLNPAINGEDRQACLRQIALDEPRRLRQYCRAIPPDLETVVLKAIAKLPEERYVSAAEFADDLQRWLDDRPIRARPPSLGQRLAKWSRRHRTLVGSVALALLFVLVSLSISTIAIWRAQRRTTEALDAAERNLKLAERRRIDAETSAESAHAARRQMDAVVHYLIDDLLGASSPHTSLGRSVTVDEVLRNAERQVDRSFREEPLVEARIRLLLGVTYRRMGDYRSADRHLSRSWELRKQNLKPEDLLVLESAGNLALLRWHQNRFEEAGEWNTPVLEVRRRVLGEEHVETLEAKNTQAMVLMGQGDLPGARQLIAEALAASQRSLGERHPRTLSYAHNLAVFMGKDGDSAEALPLHEQTLRVRREVLGAEHPDTLNTTNALAVLLSWRSRNEEARVLHARNFEVRTRVLGADHPDTLTSGHNLGLILYHLGDNDGAQELLQDCLTRRRAVLGDEHTDTVWAMVNLAGVLLARGQFDEAVELDEEASQVCAGLPWPQVHPLIKRIQSHATKLASAGRLDQCEQLLQGILRCYHERFAADDPRTLDFMHDCGLALYGRGIYSPARRWFEQVIPHRQRVLGPEHPLTLFSINNLGLVLSRLGEHEAAMRLQSETLAVRRRVLGDDHPDTLWSRHNLAIAHFRNKEHDAAEQQHREVLADRRRCLGDGHRDTVSSLIELGYELQTRGKLDDAQTLLWEAFQAAEQLPDTEHKLLATAMQNLGLAHYRAGRWDECFAIHDKLIPFCRQHLGADSPQTLQSLHNQALALFESGRHADAESVAAEVFESRRKFLGPDHRDTSHSMNLLALVWRNTGRIDEAIALYHELLERQRRGPLADDQIFLVWMNNLGFALQSAQRLDEAVRVHREALERRRRVLGNSHSDTVQSLENLGNCLQQMGNLPEAADLLVEALAACSQWEDQKPPSPRRRERFDQNLRAANSWSWNCVVESAADPADFLAALRLASAAVYYAPKEPEYWNTLGLAWYRCGHWPSALESLRQAQALRGSAGAMDRVVSAMCAWQLRDDAAASSDYVEAVRLQVTDEGSQRQSFRKLFMEADSMLGGEPFVAGNAVRD